VSRRNRIPLLERVTRAAEDALTAQSCVAPVDVLVGIRWLDPGALSRWRQGRIDCLEEAIQTHPARVSEALRLFRSWALERGLSPSETAYVARTTQRQPLRFSRGGDPSVERLYRTHWVSRELTQTERQRVVDKASRPPDLVVIQPLNRDWTCNRCGGSGYFLIMEDPGPACLRCVGLDDLEFLPAGDALLTRRAKAKSARSAVVVRFSRSRRRYERQGLLVEPQALLAVRRDLEDSGSKR
jgi:hypothetical protein